MSKYNIKLLEKGGYHLYEVDGDIFPSSTTIINKILSKPALIPWAVKEAVSYLGSRLGDIKSGKLILNEQNSYRILREAKIRHKEIKEKAADIGTIVHEIVENYLQGGSPSVNNQRLYSEDKISNAVKAFMKWKKDNDFKVIDTELPVASKKYRFAGTLDAIGMLNGKRFLGDLKTSKAIWEPEYSMQVASYRLAYEETFGEKIESMGIIRLDKISGLPEFKIYNTKEYKLALRKFLLLSKFYHLQWISN